MKTRGLALLAITLSSCGSSSSKPDDGGTTADGALHADARPSADARVVTCTTVSGMPTLALEEIATGLQQAIVITQPAGESRFFVAEKGGKIKIIENGTARATPFLDLSAKVSKGSEQGLLGLAFHPRYNENGRFFVDLTDTNGDTRVWEFHVSSDPNVADPTELEILMQDQPFTNHNGGQVQFGPDGMLYISFGDGGDAYDPMGNGQKLTTRLGKILRIDIDGAHPFRAPADNPFAAMPAPANEIFQYGLRNPWRSSFDRDTGDMWIGDVGQDKYEEIDFVPAGMKGMNFGWGVVEGVNHCPKPPYGDNCPLAGSVLPVTEYPHSFGNAVVGGILYRGCRMPDMRGTYFFSDNGTGFLRSFRYQGAFIPIDNTTAYDNLSATRADTFGEDPDGEILICSLTTGKCWRLVPAP